MNEFFAGETLFEDFSDGLMTVTRGEFLRMPVRKASLRRNEELDLILEFISSGTGPGRATDFRPGTVRAANETIEFAHPSGSRGIARGVVARSHRYIATGNDQGETIETFSASSIELNYQRRGPAEYIIEWVVNLPRGIVWPDADHLDVSESFSRSLGMDDDQLTIRGGTKIGGGRKGLFMKIGATNVYLLHSLSRDAASPSGAGLIVYRTETDQDFRDKVRACLSFALGQPIVLLGHSQYSADWVLTFTRPWMRSRLAGPCLNFPASRPIRSTFVRC